MGDDELSRSRAFARCQHDVLPLVMRAMKSEGAIWVARAKGRCMADGATPESCVQLRELRLAAHEVTRSGGLAYQVS